MDESSLLNGKPVWRVYHYGMAIQLHTNYTQADWHPKPFSVKFDAISNAF